ncbi:MAG: efflux RND transporter periplasmic adaptor subunit [Acidobacteria bacterium]|nr:efflux RND transporter periplasmic adaptor subunit [Acidobacteriota bacterium]
MNCPHQGNRSATLKYRCNTPRRMAVIAAFCGTWLGLVLFSAACSSEAARPTAAPTPLAVRVVRVGPRPLEKALDITGSLVSSVAVDVKTQFAGRVIQMLRQEGDRVRKGELLALIDETDAKLALAQARASLEVAQAGLLRAQVVEKASLREGERSENLMRSGGITQRDHDQAQVTIRDAQAQLKLAEAQVEQARQSVAIAQKSLSDCRIIAPASGEIERKFLNPGSYVDTMTLVYRVVDNHKLELETFVASSEIGAVEKGQKIRFGVQTFPGEEFEARVLTVSPAVQPQNRSVMVRAAVPNPTGKLKAGMFVKGRIVTGTKPAAFVVPLDAVWRRVGQPAYVYVVEQNQARRREVKLGSELPEEMEIAAGLEAGNVVIAEQNLELAEGVSVTPRP